MLHPALQEHLPYTEPGTCWNWNGLSTDTGYPMVNFQGQRLGVRRLMYEIHVGDIKKGASVRMHCGNVQCVNPEHMSKI